MLMLQRKQFMDGADEELKEQQRGVRMGGRMGRPVPGINSSISGGHNDDEFARLDRDAARIGDEHNFAGQ